MFSKFVMLLLSIVDSIPPTASLHMIVITSPSMPQLPWHHGNCGIHGDVMTTVVFVMKWWYGNAFWIHDDTRTWKKTFSKDWFPKKGQQFRALIFALLLAGNFPTNCRIADNLRRLSAHGTSLKCDVLKLRVSLVYCVWHAGENTNTLIYN